jgi:predicted GNAT superfamily acetyltransferase
MVPADIGWVHALNKVHETELSPLTRDGVAHLMGQAFFAQVAEPEAAFLFAFDQSADYDSPNFLWFRNRYSHFVYVDRIAVSDAHRRKGLAAQLYDGLFATARTAGHDWIVCEVNSDPPNPGSDAFHAARGFDVVGEAHLGDRGKTVRYMSCPL